MGYGWFEMWNDIEFGIPLKQKIEATLCIVFELPQLVETDFMWENSSYS